MSPIDDELRAALRGRAGTVAPAADPLAGIERRATRMRRTRAAAAVAASALAVAAIAVAVPALSPSAAPAPVGPAAASPTPDTVEPPTSYALDPRAPWAFRGTPFDDATIQREYATRTGGAEVLVTPLFAQVYEPSAQLEVVFLAEVDGAYRWGVAQTSDSGPEFVWDEALTPGATALAAALPGDEAPRLLVVAAPEAERLFYGGPADEASMSIVADGVGVAPLDRDPASDVYRVLAGGQEIAVADAPDLPGDGPLVDGGDNALDWPARGTADPDLESRAVQGYATAKDVALDDVEHRVLFTGDNDPGQRYTVLQARALGQPWQVFGWIETPGRDPEPVLRPLTGPGTPVVALLLTGIPGRTADELVVIPQPRTGQVLYTAAGGVERPVDTPGLDGVVLIDRELGADGDRIRLLDGNGDLDNPTFDGLVFDLLCGVRGCG